MNEIRLNLFHCKKDFPFLGEEWSNPNIFGSQTVVSPENLVEIHENQITNPLTKLQD